MQRRSGRQVAFVHGLHDGRARGGVLRRGARLRFRGGLARADRVFVVEGGIHGARLARLRSRHAGAGRRLQHLRIALDDGVEPADDLVAIRGGLARAIGAVRRQQQNRRVGFGDDAVRVALRRNRRVVGAPVAGFGACVAHVG